MGKTKRNVYLNPRRGEKQSFDVALACEEWSKVFGANKNIFRTTPSMIDSLKPVQLRILYCLYMSDNHGMKNRKSAAVTGEVMGKYHPHGDASIYESIVNLTHFTYPTLDFPLEIELNKKILQLHNFFSTKIIG